MELTIKGLKTLQGHDGLAFRCTMSVDGAPRFEASNDGNGGCNLYTPLRGQTWDAICEAEAWAKAQPKRLLEFDDITIEVDCDLDLVLEDLINAELDRRWLKAQCRAKTLFRLPDGKPGEWLVMNAPFDERIRARVLGKHPDAVFANETA